MIIRDGSADYEESLTFLAKAATINYYNIKYNYPSHEEFKSTFHNLSVSTSENTESKKSLAWNFTLLPTTPPVKFPRDLRNHRKLSSPCMVVLLFITELRSELIRQIRSLISPPYHPIIQKDTDTFIIVTKAGLMDQLLLMEEYPAKIKHKIAIAQGKETELLVKTVCFFCNAGEPRILELPSKFTETFNYFPDFVENLYGKVIKVSTPGHVLRFETCGPPYDGINNGKRGLWKNLLEDYLAKKLNFSYNVFVSTGADGRKGAGGTGLQTPNGTWIGTTGDVASGRADIAIVTANTLKRIEVIDFTDSFFDAGYLCFITPLAEKIYSPLAFLWPFDVLTWSCIGFSTLVAFAIFLTLSLIMKETQKTAYFSFYSAGRVQQWKFQKQFLFIMTSYLEQGFNGIPSFQPIRCFVSCWLIFTMIIITAYKSKIVSLLAFPETEKLPTTYEELANSNLKVGFVKHGDSAYNTLKASRDPTYVKLIGEMEVITGSGLPCLDKVVQGHYACIAYDSAVKYLIAKNLTATETRKVVLSQARTYTIWLGLAFESRSIYKTNMNKWLRWTRPCHLQAIWDSRDMHNHVKTAKEEWWKATNQTNKLSQNQREDLKESRLHFRNISGAFYIIAVGLVSSSIFFGCEHIAFRKKWKLHLVQRENETSCC